MARSMQEISRRIRGVNSTMQITRAMEMVASVKLRRSREVLMRSRPYHETILEDIRRILSFVKGINHPLLEEREVKSTLYIVLASDRGLAGGYNSNINRLVERDIEKNGGEIKLITVGLKSYEYFSRKDFDIVGDFLNISENPSHDDAIKIGKICLDLYLAKEIDEIKIAYTEFESIISQKARMIQLLPSTKIYEDPESKKAGSLMDFEPSAEEVLDYLIPKYIRSTIFGALIEASASEQGARQVAMESATENAEDLIEELELTYNRARQEAITMEISEIVSGAEALK